MFWTVLVGVVVFSAVGVGAWALYHMIRYPERVIGVLMRLWAPLFSVGLSRAQREAIGRAIPVLGYLWFGSTGSADKDASVRRSLRLYVRTLGVVAAAVWLVVIIVALSQGFEG